jgi:hypothetical protein
MNVAPRVQQLRSGLRRGAGALHLRVASSLLLGLYLVSWKADAQTCPTVTSDTCSGAPAFQYENLSGSAGAALVGGNYGASGYGVEGTVGIANPKSAVYGVSLYDGGSPVSAVEGYCAQTAGGVFACSGVYGYSYDVGVYGQTPHGGYGVEGNASGTPVTGVGVYGTATAGIGVEGYNSSGANNGVVGESNGAYSGGAFYNSGAGAGVYGQGLNGWAGYFDGNINVTGSITAGTKDFVIDHPLDPANKYLYHSVVESPEMKNVYDGIATLDGQGEATVELPSYFEALNRDYRYQLTSIGAFSAVYVAEEVAHNQFKIAGGQPGQRISWQVTGVRQDPYALAHPLVPEVDKAPGDLGKFLHPQEVAGLPRSAATQIGYREAPHHRHDPRDPDAVAAH